MTARAEGGVGIGVGDARDVDHGIDRRFGLRLEAVHRGKAQGGAHCRAGHYRQSHLPDRHAVPHGLVVVDATITLRAPVQKQGR